MSEYYLFGLCYRPITFPYCRSCRDHLDSNHCGMCNGAGWWVVEAFRRYRVK